MDEYKRYHLPSIPWTIEQQLKAYANAEGKTERHETLYHSWRQNSRWFSQVLEYTVASYPNYSQHNVTHCQAVIHNIECLLGEEAISQLSATDCYAILMAVYFHDIGMSLFDEDKERIICSDEFVDWIEQSMQSNELALRERIDLLRQEKYPYKETESFARNQENRKEQYHQKLKTSKATNYLIAEQQRKHHAEIAADRMRQWVSEPGPMNCGLSMTGIPPRIHLMIAECARLHGIFEMEDLMEMMMQMPQSDNGFAKDLYHPRFIAVLLLIGDALDIDNNRFHPFVEAVAGDLFDERSQTHYRKHQAIRALQVTPKKIYIRADCERPDEMRQLRNEVTWLQDFVTECSYQWSRIAPENYCGYLPMVEFERISLNGSAINEKLVKAQFHLSQDKAFKLLEGSSLYDSHFVFLREMLQNAVDAVKFQYWNDLDATDYYTNRDIGLCDANAELPLRKYPVKIDFAVRKRKRNNPEILFPITLDDIQLDKEDALTEYGVEVSVQDCGIGIGTEDVCAISKVGTSQENRQSIIDKMPRWLHPTGKFGIGLQSLFQADHMFKCVTRTHQDECFEMIFHSGANNEGYINVTPLNWREGKRGSVPYGTKFTLFVPESKKESHLLNMSGWAGMDPYDEEYEKGRNLRRSFELMKQMEAQIDTWVGESLFPLVIREEILDISLRQKEWDKKLAPQKEPAMNKVLFKKIDEHDHKRHQRTDDDSRLCWIFGDGGKQNEPPFLRGRLHDGSAYYLNVDECELHIWSQKAQCFFCCSPKRIVEAITKKDEAERGQIKSAYRGNKIKIFLKGFLVTEITYKEDELIEFIDIKNDRLQKYLYMNRNAFSDEGEMIIRNQIIPQLRETFCAVLEKINIEAIERIQNNRQSLTDDIIRHYVTLYRENSANSEWTAEQVARIKDPIVKYLDRKQLFDFTLIDDDKNWNSEADERNEEEYVPVLDLNNNSGCNNLIKGIDSDLFIGFENLSNSDNYVRRVQRNIRSKVTKRQKDGLDIFSYILNRFAEKAKKVYLCIIRKGGTEDKANINECVKDLRDHVILYAMFYYYVNRAQGAPRFGCTVSGNSQCGWEYVNQRIADTLITIQNNKGGYRTTWDRADLVHQRHTIYEELMFVPVYKQEARAHRTSWCSIAELMRNDRHYAVFSTRASSNERWKHVLIELSPERERFLDQSISDILSAKGIVNPTIHDVLNYQPENRQSCIARWSYLDRWSKYMLEFWQKQLGTYKDFYRSQNPTGVNRNNLIDNEIWENLTTRWIVRKFPSVALGSDTSGNNRLNVLCVKSDKHTFFDARMIGLIIERAKEYYKSYNALRFTTAVWDGMDGLTCENISTNILTVNRGTLTEESRKKQMLLAFGSNLPNPLMIHERRIGSEATSSYEISTFFELLDAIKSTYIGRARIEGFSCEYLSRLLAVKNNIEDMTPFSYEEDNETVEILLEYCRNDAGREQDIKLMARDKKILKQNIIKFYDALINEEPQDYGKAKRIKYNEVKVPSNRSVFINSFLLKLYGFNLDDIPEILKKRLEDTIVCRTNRNKEQESLRKEELILEGERYNRPAVLAYSEAKFDEACEEMRNARLYSEYWLMQDYRDAFLEYCCDWYWNAFWKNGRFTTLIEYTINHLVDKCTEQELELLYKTQLRRIFCAVIAGC